MNNDKIEYNGFEIPENFYFHGNEADQYNFIQVPLPLICEKVFSGISDSAKILYGLLLNRNRMSMLNCWLDKDNRTYLVFSIDNVARELGIGHTKAKKLFKELSDINGTGVGLIKKVRVMNKPSRIYVMNFMEVYAYLKRLDNSSGSGNVHGTGNEKANIQPVDVDKSVKNTKRESLSVPSVANTADGKPQMKPTVSRNHDRPSVANAAENKKINNKKINNNDIDNNHIYPICTEDKESEPIFDRPIDTERYIDLIKRNIEYDHYMNEDYPDSVKEDIEEMFKIICDVVTVPRRTIKVNGTDYPYETVKSMFLRLTSLHLEYVSECMKKTTSGIGNIRSYLITALYNSVMTMSHYYAAAVNHDMYGY